MIHIQNLSKTYGSFKALQNVNLDIDGGQVYGLLGPNGAGKTTLLRILSTLLKPSSGTASIAGLSIEKDAEAIRQMIGVVNGGMGLYDRLTGREILAYFAGFYGLDKTRTQNRIDELDEKLSLGDALTKQASGFSTGMKQKIVIARAVIHDPKVLILDEAASGLDILARRALLDFVQSYRESDRLVLYSTHVMDEIEEVSKRVAILHQGQLLIEGTLDDIKKQTGQDRLEPAFFELVHRFGHTERV